MVSTGTKRKRRDRGNEVAAAVEEGRRQAEAEKKVLGTAVTPNVPDSALFVVDRKGDSKETVRQRLQEQAAEQRRAAKRSRRNAPKNRRSESSISLVGVASKAGSFHGKKKKKGLAAVDMEILSKRHFDKPEGHIGNVSASIRNNRSYSHGKEDVWNSEISKKVCQETGLNRKRLTEKMNSAQKSAPSIIHPSSGMSVNPSHEDHQDKLGEALARIVQKDDEDKWDDQRMSFDPAILEESREGEVADTGMKCDNGDDSDTEPEEEATSCYRGVPERKTRTQRHKETRKRIMAANIARKKSEARWARDFENLKEVEKEAQLEADKLSGVEKQRRLEQYPSEEIAKEAPVLKRIGGQKVRNELASDPVPLSEELSESMRGVKMPVANPVLRDRFLSFERRGLIAPPKVLPKELWRMEQERRQEELRDKRVRKGRGSRSNLTFWRNGKRVIL